MTRKSYRSSDKRKMNERWSNQRKFMKGKGLADADQEVGFGYVEEKEELIPGKTKSVLRKCHLTPRPQ